MKPRGLTQQAKGRLHGILEHARRGFSMTRGQHYPEKWDCERVDIELHKYAVKAVKDHRNFRSIPTQQGVVVYACH